MPQPRPIDCLQLGEPHAICCWQFGELLIDPGPTSCLPNVLAALGDVRPRAVLLTHIHLDHAGAAGTLARMYPDLQVYVHERGARHMLDPSKLLASATRLYGDMMETLWGNFEPVPEDRLHTLSGGENLRFDGVGSFEVAYTPGHAVHHVSYLHDGGTAFVGDVAGIRHDRGPVMPPTPPPDIDVPAWQRSIQQLRDWRPSVLAYTHWGSTEGDVEHHLDDLSARLDRWAELAREREFEEWVAAAREEAEAAGATEEQLGNQLTGVARANYDGLRRYWKKRDERMLSADVTDA